MTIKRHRILIVDDSKTVCETLRQILIRQDYEVFVAYSAEEGLEAIKEQGLPNLAIVDLYLPKMDGFGFCRKVLSFCDLPIIMLTTEGSEQTVVEGLKHFAEDYIIKTDYEAFREKELISRVSRIINRLGTFAYDLEPIIEVDNHLKVNFFDRKAVIGEKLVSLTPIESKLLHVLMRQAGNTVQYDYLIRRLWPAELAFEDRLHTHVHRLRKKIEDIPRKPRYIRADWGNGYTFPSPFKN